VSANVRLSDERAKAAVALDLNNAKSWYLLGNAHLSLFFAGQRDFADLDRARKAYARAATLEAGGSGGGGGAGATAPTPAPTPARRNPDLHFNRGQVLLYLEEYDAAVAAFREAYAIDPALAAPVRFRAPCTWAVMRAIARPQKREVPAVVRIFSSCNDSRSFRWHAASAPRRRLLRRPHST
jgi:tetratricopeptide (TPR) repeat protein